MTATPFTGDCVRYPIRVAWTIVLAVLCQAAPALAQSATPVEPPQAAADVAAPVRLTFSTVEPEPEPAPLLPDNGVVQVNCPNCPGSSGLPPPSAMYGFGVTLPPPGLSGYAPLADVGYGGPERAIPIPDPPSQCNCGACTGCCGTAGCYPGRKPCYPCDSDTTAGRFLCGLYDCLCCPDPCYEPHWLPVANSAFFTDGVRPTTQTRLGFDSGVNVVLPDAAEFFWARADGMGKGPKPVAPARAETHLNYDDLSLYTEAATGKVSIFIEMPYRSIYPEVDPHTAGFGDMNTGIKTLLFDCELLQVSMIMRTYIPTGSAQKGLGTGHMALEPSLVFGICLAPDTYLQGQIAEWIPLGGDPVYEGAILESHFSLNQVLYRILPDVPLIGTVEFNSYSFQHGEATDPFEGPNQPITGFTYTYLGAGLRMFVCDRIDFGVGFLMALTDPHLAGQLYRSEFRFRY